MEFQASFEPETLTLCCAALEETEEIKYLWQAISCDTGTLFEKLYTRVIKWNDPLNSPEVSPQGKRNNSSNNNNKNNNYDFDDQYHYHYYY